MRCPACAHKVTRNIDSRPTLCGFARRRRYECEACGERFSTTEILVRPDTQQEIDDLIKFVKTMILKPWIEKSPELFKEPGVAHEGPIRYVECLGCGGTGEYFDKDPYTQRAVRVACGVCQGTGQMPI